MSTAERAAEQDPTIGRLVADASRDISSLVHDEIDLLKAEVKISAKAGGIGAGLFGAAALLGLLAIIMFSVALAYLVHLTGLNLAFCFLIVFAAYLGAAALLGFIGYRKFKQVRPPERAIEQAKESKQIFSRDEGVSGN